MSSALSVALIGTGFMGRAHSNAWMSVNKFFDAPLPVRLHSVCGHDLGEAQAFADRWGWGRATADLSETLADDEVDLVDVTTPNHLHADQAIASLVAGRHVACEKPMAGTIADARRMRDAARDAAGGGVHTCVWFNYRRCPAVAFARRLTAEGRLGRLYHVRACYLQDWGGPDTPFSWRFDANLAGTGAHGDLNTHVVDMARFVTGDEIAEVSGAVRQRFIEQRVVPGSASPARSTVDDCTLFLARFESGAVGSFEATRLATGNLNRNCLEINGELGSLKFDFERMNELEWFDNTAAPGLRGWTTIMCTDAAAHPYIEAYWPPGHPIGYEHQFISQAADIIRRIAGGTPLVDLPDFDDAFRTQCVIEAALISAEQGRAVKPSEVSDA